MIEARISQIGEQREQRKARKRELDAFYKMLTAMGPIVVFDEDLWNVAVEIIIVQRDSKLEIKNRTGI